MSFDFSVPGPSGPVKVAIERGASAIFVGANGSGKTRLAVFVEDAIGEAAHRISAHRSLRLNPAIPKIRGAEALRKLRYGWEGEKATVHHRRGYRWRDQDPAVAMLNDFDSLLQALFADQAVTTLDTHTRHRAGTLSNAKATKFETLSDIWHRLLPHRRLVITGDDIQVSITGKLDTYPGSEMSDGERSIFYLLAQALIAAESSLLIVDEPELHVHPSIMSKLWDEVEAARKDCGFLFITHDLQFAAGRAAQKYVLRSFDPSPSWTVEEVPLSVDFPEELATLILGSRRPILFVEGGDNSLDQAIYRCCYPDWTVVPRGSCEEVVHAVMTMRSNAQLTRVTCAGIVDADDHSADEIAKMNAMGVFPLSVSEVENLILLPAVSREIAKLDGFAGGELEARLSRLESAVLGTLDSQAKIDEVVLRYCRRRIDRALKRIDLSAQENLDDLVAKYVEETVGLDVQSIASTAAQKIDMAVKNADLPSLLSIYDNKGLIALAASHLKQTRMSAFEGWLTRMLRDETKAPDLIAVLRCNLPAVSAA
ncbi:AAA family ATPase [Stenotrophomonas sp. 9(2022)]|uniref:AAA family ATPase n=1 Tax=Stenotrophomonas sp. 9(2022) TaxID=2950153 RepID=UPI002114B09B|nr:AAA family ATPase [Stenotrophomonas sp. 9(2022)]